MNAGFHSTVRLHCVFLLGLCSFSFSHAASPQGSDTGYISRLQVEVTRWQTELPMLEKSAAAAAETIVAGGHLYVAGTQTSFIEEATGRSGGLTLCKPLAKNTKLQQGDVILAAATGADAGDLTSLLQRAGAGRAHVILFSNTQRMPDEKNPATFPAKKTDEAPAPNLSVESVSNVIGMWAWTGEFVAACISHGKMPCIYESGFMPGGTARDALVKPMPFHSQNFQIKGPIPDLAQSYLTVLAGSLTRLAQKNAAAFEQTKQLIKTCHDHNQQVCVMSIAHMFPYEMSSNPLPAWVSAATPDYVPGGNTLIIYLGYQWFPWDVATLTGKERFPSIITSSHHPSPDWVEDASHVYIDPCWEIQDASVKIPGYDVDILPISGVMQSAIFWQLMDGL